MEAACHLQRTSSGRRREMSFFAVSADRNKERGHRLAYHAHQPFSAVRADETMFRASPGGDDRSRRL